LGAPWEKREIGLICASENTSSHKRRSFVTTAKPGLRMGRKAEFRTGLPLEGGSPKRNQSVRGVPGISEMKRLQRLQTVWFGQNMAYFKKSISRRVREAGKRRQKSIPAFKDRTID